MLKKSPLNIITLIYLISIPVSSTFLRVVFNRTRDLIGGDNIKLILLVILLVMIAVLFVLFRRLGSPLVKIIPSLVFGIVIFFYLKIPEERFHLLQFGMLGMLLTFNFKDKPILLPLLIGCFWGFLDEGVQALLPNRVGEINDAVLNCLCVLWGVHAAQSAKNQSTNKKAC